MSGNRPETVHPPDDFRTVSGHGRLIKLHTLAALHSQPSHQSTTDRLEDDVRIQCKRNRLPVRQFVFRQICPANAH